LWKKLTPLARFRLPLQARDHLVETGQDRGGGI
jgi:hypothetical protein